MKKFMKMKVFSAAVKDKNQKEIKWKPFKIKADLTNNARYRALEFAKTIKKPALYFSSDRELDPQYLEDLAERNREYDRLPMYKANLRFEEERIKMFYQ